MTDPPTPTPFELADLARRPAMAPWAEGNTIPWDDPAFSARMLREHLSQAHDGASRRLPLIERHVRWLHEVVAGGRPGRVLDLACGPGLYSQRLARLGHRCLGIDFSPAAISHAQGAASDEGLACDYRLADLRGGGFDDSEDEGFDLALLIYGELDVFPPADARAILREAGRTLRPGGTLVLEVHQAATVREKGQGPRSWSAQPSGLFSGNPHLLLQESAWFKGESAAVERYYVIDGQTGAVERHAITTRATTDAEYGSWLAEAGLGEPTIHPSLSGEPVDGQAALRVLVAHKGDEGEAIVEDEVAEGGRDRG